MDTRLRQIAELQEAVANCAELLQHQSLIIQQQAENITELTIQSRFVMGLLKIQRPNGSRPSVGLDGQLKFDAIDGWEIYTRYNGRDKTLALLQFEYEALERTHRAKTLIKEGDTRDIQEIIVALEREDAEQARTASGEGDGRSDSQSASITTRADLAEARR